MEQYNEDDIQNLFEISDRAKEIVKKPWTHDGYIKGSSSRFYKKVVALGENIKELLQIANQRLGYDDEFTDEDEFNNEDLDALYDELQEALNTMSDAHGDLEMASSQFMDMTEGED